MTINPTFAAGGAGVPVDVETGDCEINAQAAVELGVAVPKPTVELRASRTDPGNTVLFMAVVVMKSGACQYNSIQVKQTGHSEIIRKY